MRLRITEQQNKKVLNEIGGAELSPYEWERETNTVYKFETENDDYIVEFGKIPEATGQQINNRIIIPANNGKRINTDNMWSLGYTTGSIDYEQKMKRTGRANVFKIISTLIDILNDFMENNNVDLIGVSATEYAQKNREKDPRIKLYLSMAQHHTPDRWEIRDIDTNRFVVYDTTALIE